MAVKRIVILGSTGSIGRRAIEVVEALGCGYRIVGLAAYSNWPLLSEQARKLLPERVVIAERAYYEELKGALAGLPLELAAGQQAVVDLAGWEGADFVLCAIPGAESIFSVLAAIGAGSDVGVASKESLVLAGDIVVHEAQKRGVALLPVDSEHSAILQAISAGKKEEIRRIILTGTGGPFRDWPEEKIRNASLEEALSHPKWSMGKKITIDSATMMNKALELIEAKHLFGIPVDKIDILIHPEAIVHSLVEFCDGAQIAQLSLPDMAIPIAYAITWPERKDLSSVVNYLDLAKEGSLSFYKPDTQKFPAIRLAYEVARQEGGYPAVFNAANEEAVRLFLEGKIAFGRIIELIERALESFEPKSSLTIEDLLAIDTWARRKVRECVDQS